LAVAGAARHGILPFGVGVGASTYTARGAARQRALCT
jgi:hypothetical protein